MLCNDSDEVLPSRPTDTTGIAHIVFFTIGVQRRPITQVHKERQLVAFVEIGITYCAKELVLVGVWYLQNLLYVVAYLLL